VRADYLSHVAEMRHHDYSIPAELPGPQCVMERHWSQHMIDLFASRDNVKPLAAPHTGRFCSHYYHPDAAWVDGLSLPWDERDVHWAFPPPHLLTRVIGHFRACSARGTLIIPDQPGAQWWPTLRSGHGWARLVCECRPLGPA
jgi:hypothetical protein